MKVICYFLAMLSAFVQTNTLWAQDKTESPYFYLPNKDTDLESFPLLHTEANVDIAGVIADVRVTQLYQNTGEQPIEAIYVFPASTRAAVYDLQMTIGERVIRAVIKEEEEARQTYEKAKDEGRSASLLEQHRPNVFQMSVANIMPGDTIRVELFYTELLVPEEGVYEFVYPTVVGPRYTSSGESEPTVASQKWMANPYLQEGASPTYTFDIDLDIRAGMPIRQASCPSHEVDVNFRSKQTVQIGLKETERDRGNKDFILRYQLEGEQIESGLLLYEGEYENFFLMMMMPPERPAGTELPSREYIFLLDLSGSMHGFPLDVSKKMMGALLNKLSPRDKFNILTFAGSAGVLAEKSIPATRKNIEQAMQVVLQLRGSGGTEMLPAVRQAMQLPKETGVARSFVILTDGYISAEAAVFDYIRNHLGEANFFAFGIGKGVNRHLIDGIAHAGAAEPFVVEGLAGASQTAERFRKYVQTPVLTDISVSFQNLDVYDVVPAKVPDLMGERPIVVFGKYRRQARGKLVVSGQNRKGMLSKTMPFISQEVSGQNSALRYLWARHQLKTLADYANPYVGGADLQQEITALGLKYNLLTSYTSFVAVDERLRNTSGAAAVIRQPLPLPENVSGLGVGVPPCPPAPPPPPSVEEVFRVVEEMPRFPGCEEMNGSAAEIKICADEKMMQFIYGNLQYPAKARADGIEGMVVVSFVVGQDGRIRDIEIVRDIGGECGLEVKRLIQLMIDRYILWIPGKQRGRPVDVQYNLPVRFRLADDR